MARCNSPLPPVLLLLPLTLLLLLAPLATLAAKDSCPGDPAAKCGLARQADLDDATLAARVALGGASELHSLFRTSRTRAYFTAKVGGTGCTPSDKTKGPARAECESFPSDTFPSFDVSLSCPDGFTAAIEFVCVGLQVSPEGVVLSSLPVLGSGAYDGTTYCSIGTSGLPPGADVELFSFVTCSFYQKKGKAAAGTENKTNGSSGSDGLLGSATTASSEPTLGLPASLPRDHRGRAAALKKEVEGALEATRERRASAASDAGYLYGPAGRRAGGLRGFLGGNVGARSSNGSAIAAPAPVVVVAKAANAANAANANAKP